MSAIVIRECSADELANASNFDALCAEYAAESGRMPEFGEPKVDIDAYRAMEAAGVAHFLGVWNVGAYRDELVGFGVVTLSTLPHFSKRIGCLISFFVAANARNGSAGTRLREAAERIASENGAAGLMISAPCESRLDVILPRSGYRATNRMYFKGFAQ
ncbi:GNAT family N-acetyltransferase [Burkholderia sp. Leaf177]|uniref:GNAT family N-acetyltransferase n=1 Tax=Burkholderia sp. Leaf177 TaxID=1736287 RepID=UPI000A8635AE|nr:GNAT family N-acetyltransferase [Burkholderia sp. Leaf177]